MQILTQSTALRHQRWAAPVLAAAILLPATAWAAQHGANAPGLNEARMIAAIVLLVLVGRLLGEAMLRVGQSAIVGQLLAGVILGPSVFGLIWPQAQHFIFSSGPEQEGMVAAIAHVGVLLLLLLTGMETDMKLVRRSGRAAAAVSLAGIAIPFVCGFVLGQSLPLSLLPPGHRLAGSLFLGTALSISSVKIVAGVVREMNFMRRNLGQTIIASAIIEDSIGWAIVAIVFGLAQTGRIDAMSLLHSIGGVALFLLASFTVGRTVVFRIIRWVNDNFLSEFAVVTAIVLIMGAMALITYAIGVQTVLGAFVAGVLVGQSPILTEHIQQQLRGLVAALFMPVFFGHAGIEADLSILAQPQLLGVAGLILLVASVGKFGGAFAGGVIGGMSLRESFALGCGMNARGSTEVIVATVGLSAGVLTQDLFTMIVAMAVVTTMAMPPMLRAALARLPMNREERTRIEREEMDARGFVARLERMLLAVDNSATGKFAARLAGFLAGAKGMPMTVMHAGSGRNAQAPEIDLHEAEIEAGARQSSAAAAATETEKPPDVEITRWAGAESSDTEEIAGFSRKGFDFLFIGIANTRPGDGDFSSQVTALAKSFEGPLAVLVPPENAEPALNDGILVPLSGTDVSRRGAEIAIVLARAADASVSALYVSGAAGRGASARGSREAVLKDIAKLGARYEVAIGTLTEEHELAGASILKEATIGHDLIVMGVSRRPGNRLFFGDTAASLMKNWKGAILFVAS